MYKSITEIVRKHYKYITVEQDFFQPLLSDNGTLGQSKNCYWTVVGVGA